jgi:hypothetical protein
MNGRKRGPTASRFDMPTLLARYIHLSIFGQVKQGAASGAEQERACTHRLVVCLPRFQRKTDLFCALTTIESFAALRHDHLIPPNHTVTRVTAHMAIQ